ncbi:MAG TPA: Gfo/Idh/MocA family oxidoreductase [Steroidobacteraceae bacterium]
MPPARSFRDTTRHMNRLKVALIGCGWAGELQMTRGFDLLPELFEVTVCCSRHADGRRSFSAKHHIPRDTNSFDEVLAMRDIDVVSICTPPPLHHDMIVAALAADKYVICEKPLVSSLWQLDAIIDADRRAMARVMPIFQYRFGSAIPKLKEIIGSGLAGRPYVASVETLLRRTADYYRVEWRGKFATELGGVLVTQAIHNHDLLLHLMGPVSSLAAFKATLVNPVEVEDCAAACLRLESGALASLTATLGSARPSTRMRLCFERATFERQCFDAATSQLAEEPWNFTASDPDVTAAIRQIMTRPADGPAGFASQFLAFHQALAEDGPLPVTLTDARRALELITGMFHSEDSDSIVALPITSNHPKYRSWAPQ